MVRIKQRYLLVNLLYPASQPSSNKTVVSFQTPTPTHINAGLFVAHLRNHISLLFGDFGLGVSLNSLKVVYLSNATSTLILRVPRNHHRLVWAALSHITELPTAKRGGVGEKCVVRVVRVSGTIKKAEEEVIRRARQDVVRVRLAGDDGENAAVTRSGEQLVDEDIIEDPVDVGEDDYDDSD